MSEGSPPSGRPIRFQSLMRQRVQHVLLVSSLYDSFILAEDGQLNEAILGSFLALNLGQNPDLTRVSTGAEALAVAGEFELILTSMHVGDMDAVELARRVREAGLDVPVILLAYDNRALTDFRSRKRPDDLDRAFLWQGDVRILPAMIKYVEDRQNVTFDTGVAGVPAVIVIEDNVRFYSSFLPLIYAELVDHVQGLMAEGLNLSQKMLRHRARPKVLLCETYEEAWSYFTTYRQHVLGVISDIEFPRGGELDRQAGVTLASRMREERPDLPIMLQSSFPENQKLSREVGASFLLKGSPVLLQQLRQFMLESFGFGEFVFRTPDQKEIDRAHDLQSLAQKLRSVPVESLAYHGERHHFSNWLKARGEFALAQGLRPRQVSDYASLEDLRQDLIRAIDEYRSGRDRVIVADFRRESWQTASRISRIGGGSLGGKARGLAFINRLLDEFDVAKRFPSIQVLVPSAVVLGTDVFDRFLAENDLEGFALHATSDAEVEDRFLAAALSQDVVRDLESFLRSAPYPLAVRSSGLLEDSPSQPFAGLYATYMLPNHDADPSVRLAELVNAVRRVYASTFSRRAKEFLSLTPYRLEQEKMAVILQEVVGARHGSRFYPDFSGVARSHNFYPAAPMKAEDGIVAVALGLGEAVVSGVPCVRFCPRYPRHGVGFSSAEQALDNSQREFYALDLSGMAGDGQERWELACYGLDAAEQDGTLAHVASTYSPDNDVIYDGLSRPGVRVVTFAPLLKHDVFPLAELLRELLRIGSLGMSAPVEIEFAVKLSVPLGSRPEFGCLQMRPLARSSDGEDSKIGHVLASQLVCRSSTVLGNGTISDLRDLVVVDERSFDRRYSVDVAQQVARFNATISAAERPYLLVGVGRWGSADPHLGIPVSWNQIAGARVIVEAGFRDFLVEPSQGTHFFQNITSCNVGYFTVNPGDGFLDWDWLRAQPAVAETEFVRHVRLESPVLVKMSGREGQGVILKPGSR